MHFVQKFYKQGTFPSAKSKEKYDSVSKDNANHTLLHAWSFKNKLTTAFAAVNAKKFNN